MASIVHKSKHNCTKPTSALRADRKRQARAVDNRHDFHAFSALCRCDIRTAVHHERRVDEAFFLIKRAFVAKLLGNGLFNTRCKNRAAAAKAPRQKRAREPYIL
jgi:hypothetical protein